VSHCFVWDIRFVISGPDARYNPASEGLNRHTLSLFISALQEALSFMMVTETKPVIGNLTKHIEYPQSYDTPRLYVKASASYSNLQVGLSSGTYEFYCTLSKKEVEQTITILQSVESEVKSMINSLKANVFPEGIPIRDGFETPWGNYIPYEFEYETLFVQPTFTFRHLFSKEKAIVEAVKKMKTEGWELSERQPNSKSIGLKILRISPKF
jgi:hypothetical protein